MPFGVTMFVDEESESSIRNIWQEVKDAGISSFMLDSGIRPHITLAVYNELDLDPFLEKLSSFKKDISPISLSLSSIGAFLKPHGIVFLAPTVTHRLMNMHSKFHTDFHDLEHSLSEYSLPGRWFPHFTLAGGLSDKDILKVIKIGLAAALPDQSRIEEIGIGEFSYINGSRSYQVTWLYNFSII